MEALRLLFSKCPCQSLTHVPDDCSSKDLFSCDRKSSSGQKEVRRMGVGVGMGDEIKYVVISPADS